MRLGLQCDWFAVRLVYSTIGIQCDCFIVRLFYSETGVQYDCFYSTASVRYDSFTVGQVSRTDVTCFCDHKICCMFKILLSRIRNTFANHVKRVRVSVCGKYVK